MVKHTALPPNLSPRLLSRAAAAEYVGVSPNMFDDLIAKDVMPEPKCLGTHRIAWDVRDLDVAISELQPRKVTRKVQSENDTWSDIDAA